jgi:Glutaminase A six helical-hairpin domain
MHYMHSRGVSVVDTIFPAFPLFLQTNPVIAGALLKPLLQWQQAGSYPHPWATHDLGTPWHSHFVERMANQASYRPTVSECYRWHEGVHDAYRGECEHVDYDPSAGKEQLTYAPGGIFSKPG